MVRARTVAIASLAPKAPQPRALSPRQLVAQKREAEIRRALGKLKPGQVVILEPSDSEMLATLRLSLKRVLAEDGFKDYQSAGRDGVFYVVSEALPFGRRGRKPKA